MLPVIILAGGLAKRMRPLTENIPKALLPVNCKPFIDLQLELLRKNGINRVVLCVGYLGEQIEQYVASTNFGMDIVFSYDGDNPLGTGGAARKAAEIAGKAFFVLYGDSYLEINYAHVQRTWENSGKPALMTVYRNENCWDTSNVLFEDNRIIRYSKTERTAAMLHIDYGLGVLQKDILNGYGERFDLADVYSSLAECGELSGYEAQNRFYEIGSPNGLKELEEHLNKRMMFKRGYSEKDEGNANE
jgi:NDP-sugar pyrophosphorylase family protein